VDEIAEHAVMLSDARELLPPAELETKGFTLRSWPTKCKDFTSEDELINTYYTEMISLVKEACGAKRVLIFDHTIRESGKTNLNARTGGSAGAVSRVHCDYTAESAPRRLALLGKQGVYSRVRKRMLTEEDVAKLARGRYAFVNVWRSISDQAPVMQAPLAVCDEASVDAQRERFLYQLRFPERTGETYSLRHSANHRWFYYPRMTKDECLLFKVFDKKEDGPRFVFHTAINDPLAPENPPSRRSIEVRAIAFFEAGDDGDDHDAAGYTAFAQPHA
jgi:hypothetical protein